jgi:hypothetical protein
MTAPEEKVGIGSEHKQANTEQKASGANRRPNEASGSPAYVGGGVDTGTLVTSAALIGVGALVMPELLAGMAIGAGAVLVSGLASAGLLRPVLRTVVKAGYTAAVKTQEFVAEASEDVRDMFAEARSDYQNSESSLVTRNR